jgi:hypothetical protein
LSHRFSDVSTFGVTRDFFDTVLCARHKGRLNCARPTGHGLPHAFCTLHNLNLRYMGLPVEWWLPWHLPLVESSLPSYCTVDPINFAGCALSCRFMCCVASSPSRVSNSSRTCPHRNSSRMYPVGSQLLLRFVVVEQLRPGATPTFVVRLDVYSLVPGGHQWRARQLDLLRGRDSACG